MNIFEQKMVPEEDSRLTHKILNYRCNKFHYFEKAPNKAPNHKS